MYTDAMSFGSQIHVKLYPGGVFLESQNLFTGSIHGGLLGIWNHCASKLQEMEIPSQTSEELRMTHHSSLT